MYKILIEFLNNLVPLAHSLRRRSSHRPCFVRKRIHISLLLFDHIHVGMHIKNIYTLNIVMHHHTVSVLRTLAALYI